MSNRTVWNDENVVEVDEKKVEESFFDSIIIEDPIDFDEDESISSSSDGMQTLCPAPLPAYKTNKFTCDICNHSLSYKHDLIAHLNHHQNGPTPQSGNDVIVAMKKPKKTALRKGRPLLTCDSCGGEFHSKTTLSAHMKQLHSSHTDKDKPSNSEATCLYCNEEFLTVSRLMRHVNKSHSDVDCFMCDTCGISFKTYQGLKRHIWPTHKPWITDEAQPHARTQRKFTLFCPVCNKGFTLYDYMRKHMRDQHDNGLDVWNTIVNRICTKCSQMFPTVECLQDHRIVHKPFQCNICKGYFTSALSLENHARTHANAKERKFKCNVRITTFLLPIYDF